MRLQIERRNWLPMVQPSLLNPALGNPGGLSDGGDG